MIMKNQARQAGFIYMLYFVTTIAANLIGRAKIINLNDADQTLDAVLQYKGAFRMGLLLELLSALLFVLTAWSLYLLLKRVDRHLALLFLLINITGSAVQAANVIHLVAGELVLHSLPEMAMVHFELFEKGFMTAQLFFGAWLIPLGFLVYKSGFIPRGLGILLLVHSFFWLLTFVLFFLTPQWNGIVYISYPLGFMAEFSLSLWLMVKGCKERIDEID